GVAALRHAKLRLSNMENTILRGCDLSGATLTGARLAGADFKGAILIGADLREADLSKVEGLTSGQIEKSLCDMSTRLPPGVMRTHKPGE
ncbi:MAG: pentapeptide repeat-containing protein, partial [Rhodospirillaceae bacterium]|nr:pentapeptide repeat-containing protein [Rhodospirillaceae bacterium]